MYNPTMSLRVERNGPVTTVILDRAEVRNAVDQPTATHSPNKQIREWGFLCRTTWQTARLSVRPSHTEWTSLRGAVNPTKNNFG